MRLLSASLLAQPFISSVFGNKAKIGSLTTATADSNLDTENFDERHFQDLVSLVCLSHIPAIGLFSFAVPVAAGPSRLLMCLLLRRRGVYDRIVNALKKQGR